MTTEQREPLYASTAKPWLKYYDQKYIDMPLPKCSAFEYLCHQNKNHLSVTAMVYTSFGCPWRASTDNLATPRWAALLRGMRARCSAFSNACGSPAESGRRISLTSIIYQVSLSIFSLLTLSVIANAMPPPPKWEALAVFANFIFMPRALPSGELASEARLRG